MDTLTQQEVQGVLLVALADWSGGSPTATSVLERAGCYICLPPWELEVLKARLVADIALAGDPGADVTAVPGCTYCLPLWTQRVEEARAVVEIVAGDATEMLGRAACWICHTAQERSAMEAVLLADILLGLEAGADVTASGLLARSGCFYCKEEGELLAGMVGNLVAAGAEDVLTTEDGSPITTEDGGVLVP